nr:ABC transporter ATP-binding protein [Anaerolineae bacterium]
MTTPVLELDSLECGYGQQLIVNALSIHLREGDIGCLLGPSGCGKTTTLRAIAGFEPISGGSILLDGKALSTAQHRVAPEQRQIGMVFQDYALFPHLSVAENVGFGIHTSPDRKRVVDELLSLVKLDKLGRRYPHELSGGQQQRVAVARALVKEPDILLFDEPLSNLDAKLRIQMRAELKRLQMELGITTIYVTHDQVEAMTMADRIAVMNAGRLQQCSTPEELYDHPRNLFVAGFIGSPPMNFLSVRLEESDGRYYLKREGFELEIPAPKGALALKHATGPEVVMGIRPEDIALVPQGEGIPAEVYITEPLGRDLLIDLKLAGVDVRALVDPSVKAEVGEVVGLKFNAQKVHLFDPETEESLLKEE